MEECPILRSRKAIQPYRCYCNTSLISCSLDPVLWMSTPRYMNDSRISTLTPATGTWEPGEGGVGSLNLGL